MSTIDKMFERQKEFSDLFFKNEDLTDLERQEMTKSFSLAMHAEVTNLANSVNFKDHRLVKQDVDKRRILYKERYPCY